MPNASEFFIIFEDQASGSVLGYVYPGKEFAYIQDYFPNLHFYLVKRASLESVHALSALLRLSEDGLRKNPHLRELLAIVNAKNSKGGVKTEEQVRGEFKAILTEMLLRGIRENVKK